MKHAELNRQIKKAFLEIESMRFREYPEIYDERSGADIDYSERYVKYINNLFENGSSNRIKIADPVGSGAKASYVFRPYMKRAACAAAVVIIAGGAFIAIDDGARAAAVNAAQRVFSFIPGTETFVENNGSGIIAMQGSVRAEFDGGYIKVNSAYIDSGSMKITLEGTVTFNGSDGMSVCDKDKKSVSYPDEINWMSDEGNTWSAVCTFNIKNVKYDKNAVYFVNINGNEVPIALAPAQKITENVNYYEDADTGISAAAITEYTDNGAGKLKLSVSAKSNAPDSQISFGDDGIKLVKSDNSVVLPESCIFSENGKCTAVFDTLLDEDTKLIISNAELHETPSGSDAPEFNVKRGSSLNRTFDINGKEIKISGAEWESYYNNMSMRLPDGKKADAGSKAQKIIFNADIQGKLADKLKLTGLALKPDSGSANEYEYNGQRLVYEDPDRAANEENTSKEVTGVTACAENIKPDISSANIEISGISYKLKNDITIKLAV